MTPTSLTLYDTTLRDGTQGTAISFSVADKIRIAQKLDEFGIHFIEGGWPGSNPRDASFFKEARNISFRHAKLAAFGSTRRGGLSVHKDPQLQMLLEAETPVVTIVGKSWLLHVTDVLGVSPAENLAMIRESIEFLKSHDRIVFYDAEHFFDSFRESPDYALQTLQAAYDGGADTLVLCDTNGGSLPDFIRSTTHEVVSKFPIPIGIHTHDDSGLGVANALAAIQAGASQVQGTINGYGERVGNCNLTTLIPNLQLKLNIPCIPELSRLRELSLFVDEIANLQPNIRAPYVGSAAFTHKGGLHVHAVQKLARTYEHIDPSLVGNRQTIVVSDMSGQSNILAKASQLGLNLEKGSPVVAQILKEVKELENQGYEFEAADGSLELLIRRTAGQKIHLFDLREYHCFFWRRGSDTTCEATVKLSVNGQNEYTVAEGDGPVNALDAALRKALRPFYNWIDSIQLTDYKVRIVDSGRGTAARTRVHILSSDGKSNWGTVGVSDNIIEASWQALVDSFELAAIRSSNHN
ncbi:MAG: citramalate synthase [Chthoniobacterales bacterium]|nr:citramalate synthase [Chthoniobacterales bacterium]